MRAKKLTEKEFLQQVRDYARLMGWMVYHAHDSRKSPAGFPDLVMVREPEVAVAELKVGNGRLTAAQEKWLDAFSNSGVVTFVWRPDDWSEIEQVLGR